MLSQEKEHCFFSRQKGQQGQQVGVFIVLVPGQGKLDF